MKIIICTHKFMPPFIGGVDIYTDRLRKAFIRSGHEVSILAFNSTADIATDLITIEHATYEETSVVRLHFSFEKRPKYAFDILFDPELSVIVSDILKKEKPSLIIIMNFYTITFSIVQVAKELSIPVAHIVTDFLPVCRRATYIRWDGKPCQQGETIKSCSACFVSQNPFGRFAAFFLSSLSEKNLLWLTSKVSYYPPLKLLNPYWNQVTIMEKRARKLQPLREGIDLVLAPTRYTREVFIKNGFRENQVQLLPFGADTHTSISGNKKTPSSHVRFLFIGRLQPYKGVHILVDAFNRLRSPKEATLTIYGAHDGYSGYVQKVMAMIARNERIRFAGQILPSNISSAFADNDFFVLPSLWNENSPLVLLDALQSKTPVIASDIHGVADLIVDGTNGILFEMGNPRALAHVIQRVIDTPSLQKRLVPNTSLLSIDDYARMLIDHFKKD